MWPFATCEGVSGSQKSSSECPLLQSKDTWKEIGSGRPRSRTFWKLSTDSFLLVGGLVHSPTLALVETPVHLVESSACWWDTPKAEGLGGALAGLCGLEPVP